MEEVKSRRHIMTDDEVEAKIAELKDDPDVRLAWKEKTVKYKRRRYLGALQSDKRRGEQLREAGITWEMLDEQEGLLKDPDYPA